MRAFLLSAATVAVLSLLATACAAGAPGEAAGTSGAVPADAPPAEQGDAGWTEEEVAPEGPPQFATAEELVRALYGALGQNDAATACPLFSPSAQAALLDELNMPTCEAAVDLIYQYTDAPETLDQITVEIEDPNLAELNELCTRGIRVRNPAGGIPPGSFAYRLDPSRGGWVVSGFSTQSCGG